MSFVKSATSTTHLRDASEGIEKAESPPAHLQPRTIVDVDPDGDLFLDVALDTKGVAYRYRVCSGTLRRHSPVWKTMLFGPWLESKPTNSEEWVVQLPEDPAYPMLIILNIVHGRFADVPQDIRLGNLRDILALTNKYDMTSIVRPLCAQWIAVARRSKNSTEKNSTGDFSFKRSAKNTLRSLYVAWELGDEVLFALRLEELSLRTRMDTEGRLSYATSRRSRKGTTLNDENYLGPQDALGGLALRKIVEWSTQLAGSIC